MGGWLCRAFMDIVLMRGGCKLSGWVVVVVLCAAVRLGGCEEWYQPDSRLISDAEFAKYVVQDKSAFKIVKYFSPGCVYCRYLKQVVDLLKHEKQWCFRIYDFNCAWYPQHCMQNVRSASFPYTAIHNANGELHEEIHGFYPEPVIRTIFERIEQACLDATKKAKSSLSQEDPADSTQNKEPAGQQGSAEPSQPGKQDGVGENNDQQQNHEAATPENKEKQREFDNPAVPTEEESIDIPSQQETPPPPQSEPHRTEAVETDAYLKYAVYGITVLIAAFYFHKINKGKELDAHPLHSQEASPLLQRPDPAPRPTKSAPQPDPHAEAILRAQSQLSASIADEQL